MLQIKNISKTYKTGGLIQKALDDVSLNLRDNEFVAILGPSGSGKTTLLNIIGGLDKYDEGDLLINNISTKKYKSRDFDAYRNHTIGFVFQSYNLIPHQTILSNVELALTIGGISKKKRKKLALEALDSVGLKDQAHKKPNQLSGGQMQRVAIARALVNNPDILLADEPTGALDTKTSIQVMDLLKEVAKDKLVVMVTHNPELANEYANRIVRLKDGKIISDSNPYYVEDKEGIIKRFKKASMSYFTALSLSFNNLLTKKGRTLLTAFAGSIGIIGIALILSLSNGFQNYIDQIQEDTLTSYPLTITSETADTNSAILSMISDKKENSVEGDLLQERQYMTTMFSSIGSNDLKTFKKYLEENDEEVSKYAYLIKYTYSVVPNIYTIDVADNLAKLNPSNMMNSMMQGSSMSLMMSSGGIYNEINDEEAIKDNYDLLKGRLPNNYDELLIVLSEPNNISDLLVYSLGLRDTTELKTIMTSLMSGEEVDIKNDPITFTYDDLLNLDLRLILTSDTYKYNEEYDIYEDMNDDKDYMLDVYDNSLKLKVVGVVAPKKDNNSNTLSAGVAYKKELTEYVINASKEKTIVQKQLLNKDIDVFSNKSFLEENETKENKLDFNDMISIDEDVLKDAFKVKEINMLSSDELSEIALNTAKQVENNISNGANAETYVTAFNMIDLSLITPKITKYQSDFNNIIVNPLTYQTSLSLNNIEDEKYQVTKQEVQEALNNNEQFKSLASLLSEEDYANLTAAANSMFIEFFNSLKELDGYDESNNSISFNLLDYNDPSTLYFGNDTSNTLMTLLMNVSSDLSTNASALNGVVAINIIKNLTTYMIASGIGEAIGKSMAPIAEAFNDEEGFMSIDTDAFAKAFNFDTDKDELQRIMSAMLTSTDEKTFNNNLISLGYQDFNDPTSISFYFKNFESKENFLAFLERYNEGKDEEDAISYTDITGILMSGIKTIVDSVSYVLIAFVSISLIVSSIMIAVITLISVMERTKEIGILRAMGASKMNISNIFSAETFIIGLLSGVLGILTTLALLPPINNLIHSLTNNYDINAVLPFNAAIILIIISVVLTMIAGFIPSKKAAKQDPVIALRSE